MSSFDYSGLEATAFRLIDRFGRDVTVLKYAETAVDPAKPWRGSDPAAPTAVTAKAVVVADKATDEAAQLVRRGTVEKYLVSPVGLADLVGFEKINDGGRIRDIEEVEVVETGPTRLLYKIAVAK